MKQGIKTKIVTILFVIFFIAGQSEGAILEEHSMCVEDIGVWGVWYYWGICSTPGQEIPGSVESTDPDVLGVSLSADGPFTDFIEITFTCTDNYRAYAPVIWKKGLATGTATEKYSIKYGFPWEIEYLVGEVSSLELEEINSPLDDNPLVGGGKRIFPGKQSPSDTVTRNTVRVRATIDPPDSKVPIRFKSYDVDDPSSDGKPVDPKGDPYGDDNNGGCGSFKSSSGCIASVTPDDYGVAIDEFTVPMQPGDNVRIMATCSGTYLSGVTVNGTNLEDEDGNTLPQQGAPVTEMITVWRRLHIELDSMGPVTENYFSGRIVTVKPHKKFSVLEVDPPLGNENRKRFENGAIWIDNPMDPNDPIIYNVKSNGSHTLSVMGLVTWMVEGQNFLLFDDDDFNGNNTPVLGDWGEDVPAPDTSFLQDKETLEENRLLGAYIKPTYDLGSDTNVPFVLNLATPNLGYDFDYKNFHNDPNFWTIYLLGAYQSGINVDGDPNKGEKRLFGSTDLNGEGAAIFHETLKEAGRNSVATTAHEVGHLLGGSDHEGGLMNYPSDAYPYYSDQTIAKMRAIKHP